MHSNTPWPEERVERLKLFFYDPAGYSYGMIAEKLGGINRNAVIGKIHRMGLSRQYGGVHTCQEGYYPKKPKKQRRPRPVLNENGELQIKPPIKRTRPVLNENGELQIKPPIKPITHQDDLKIPHEQRKTLLELNGHTCRWPVGDPIKPDFFFCGGYAKGTYCEAHLQRACNPGFTYPIITAKRQTA